jgi:hypothetical protein
MLVIDEFIYDPNKSRGELSIRIVKGVFLYVRSLIEGERPRKFGYGWCAWAAGHNGLGRPNRRRYGVVVLSSEVTVTGRRGTVTLKQGQGTRSSATANLGGRLAGREAE